MAEKTGGSKGQQPEALKTFGAASRAGSVKPEDQGLTATSETRPKPKDSAQKNEAAAEVLNAGATGKPKTSGGSGAKARPEKLTASQLKSALATTKASARACGPEHGADAGTGVQVKLSIEGATGSVVSASARGDHAGTSLGACVARALARTDFPKFSANRI